MTKSYNTTIGAFTYFLFLLVICFISCPNATVTAQCREIPTNTDNNSTYDLEWYGRKVKSRYIKESTNIKEVFLTFDDGPSAVSTMKILNILRAKNVKATFFLVGNRITQYPQITKRLAESNMCLAPHTYSHQYKIIYKSVDSYFEDLKKCRNSIKAVTGMEPVKYVRFAGGSDNEVTSRKNLNEIRKKLCEQNISYVDWNVSGGDAEGPRIPKEIIEKNIISQSKNSKLVVVLMHDSDMKKTTVDALPCIIDFFKNNGYEFKTFDKVTSKEENIMKKIGVLNRVS